MSDYNTTKYPTRDSKSKKFMTQHQYRVLENRWLNGHITFSKMIEMINEEASRFAISKLKKKLNPEYENDVFTWHAIEETFNP